MCAQLYRICFCDISGFLTYLFWCTFYGLRIHICIYMYICMYIYVKIYMNIGISSRNSGANISLGWLGGGMGGGLSSHVCNIIYIDQYV